MNTKYIPSFPYIEYEEHCHQLLERMANDGWTLEKVGLFFKFKKTNQYYKHQIDLTPKTEEYNEIIEDLGYQYIGSCGQTNFYISEDPEAVDLMTDNEVLKKEHLKRYNLNHLLWILLGAIYLIRPTYRDLISASKEMAFDYFVRPEQYINMWTVVMMAILLGIVCLQIIFKRDAIEKNEFTYDRFKYFDGFVHVFKCIVFILLSYAYINISTIESSHIIYTIILVCFRYFQLYIFSRAKTKDDEIYYPGITMIVVGCVLYVLTYFGNYHLHNKYNDPILYNLPTSQVSSYAFKENCYVKLITATYSKEGIHLNIQQSEIVYLESKNEKAYDACLEAMILNMDEIGQGIYKGRKSLLITDENFIYKIPYDENIDIMETTTNIINYYHQTH